MLTPSYIFSRLTSSTFVLDVNGLIRPILCLICIVPHYNVPPKLFQHGDIKNGPLYEVSYFTQRY